MRTTLWAATVACPLALLAKPAAAQGRAGAAPARSDEWYLPVSDGCRLYVYELVSGRDTVIVLHGGFGAELGVCAAPFGIWAAPPRICAVPRRLAGALDRPSDAP